MKWKTNSGTRLWVRDSPNHHAGQDCGGSGCHSSRDKMAVRVSQRPRHRPPRPAPARRPWRPPPWPARAARCGRTSPAGNRSAVGPGVLPGTESAGPFRHASVGATACVTCHTAASGGGKPPGHISTSDSCQSCHTHARVAAGQGRGSHPGARQLRQLPRRRTATGKPSRHLPTSNACESCHTSNAWTPARFDHAAVAPHTCTTCHNSVRAIGMPRVHIPTTQQCDVCHGTLAWKPAKVDHTGLRQRLRHLPQQHRRGRPVARAHEHPARLLHLPRLPGLERDPLPPHQRRLPGHAPRRARLRELPHFGHRPGALRLAGQCRHLRGLPREGLQARGAPEDQGAELHRSASWPTAVVPATCTARRRRQPS